MRWWGSCRAFWALQTCQSSTGWPWAARLWRHSSGRAFSAGCISHVHVVAQEPLLFYGPVPAMQASALLALWLQAAGCGTPLYMPEPAKVLTFCQP